MFRLGSLARRLLHRAGYLTLRPPHGVSDDLPTYLRRLQRENAGPLNVVCVDDDTGVQSDLLRNFSLPEVWFCSPLELHRQPPPPPFSSGATSILILGLFPNLPDSAAAAALWGRPWNAVLLRAQLGSFWRGETDLSPWIGHLNTHGFTLTDVLARPSLSPLQSPADSILLAARPHGSQTAPSAQALGRVAEVNAFLSIPLLPANADQILTGRGSSGFSAGIFNPGAVGKDGRIQLLARAESAFWRQQKEDEAIYFSTGHPCALEWDAFTGLSPARPCRWAPPPALPAWRAEDFRLFRFRGQTFSNHSLISRAGPEAVPGRALNLAQQRCRIAFSRVDFPAAELAFVGHAAVDVPTGSIEKNWAVIPHGDRLFLLYAAEPFHLLELQDWNQLRFRTKIRQPVRFPFSSPHQALRNSLNPVDYDENHWLHVVHRVYPGKQYCFWAILIDKQRLQPAFALARPLARSGHPFPASVLYLCSAVATPTAMRFFFGVNDAGLGTVEVSRRTLDAQWQRLPD
jgi:hypothetical protein